MTLSLARAKELLAAFPKQKILVVGDLMLDRFTYGTVSRISPEAPVPVVQITHERAMPGGASNVAWNIQAIGGKATAAGIIGQDSAGDELLDLLNRGQVQTSGILSVPTTHTTVKTRIIAERQQVVRVDRDNAPDFPSETIEKLSRHIRKEMADVTGVILADYGKGVVNQEIANMAIKEAQDHKIPCGMDPKDNHVLQLHGLTLATPNRKEAFNIAGTKDSKDDFEPLDDVPLQETGRRLVKHWGADLVIVTLGPKGMLLVKKGKKAEHIPTRAQEVFDVSGAGDTVIAVCLLSLAAGATYEEAAEMGNYAAGVVVGKLGTATCSPEELLENIKKGAGHQ